MSFQRCIPSSEKLTRRKQMSQGVGGSTGVTGKKTFTFLKDLNSPPLQLTVHEVYEGDYALFTWPSAPVLAQYIFYNREVFEDKTVLEISSGTSLPGMTAALMGAKKVVLTDRDSSVGKLVEQNLRTNGLSEAVAFSTLTWGSFDVKSSRLVSMDFKFDFILASDCFYDVNDFENILCTIHFLLRFMSTPGAQFLTTFQERVSGWSIECLLKKWNLEAEYIPLDRFEANASHLLGSDLPGHHNICLFRIHLNISEQEK